MICYSIMQQYNISSSLCFGKVQMLRSVNGAKCMMSVAIKAEETVPADDVFDYSCDVTLAEHLNTVCYSTNQ